MYKRQHIARTADILRAENDLLDAQAAALLPPEGTTLPCAALLLSLIHISIPARTASRRCPISAVC